MRALICGFALVAAGCAGHSGESLVIYTSVTQATVDAVVEGFEGSHPGVSVEVFRAPTGEVNARLAAERRDGGVRADVLWMTDPLSMQQYDRDGLVVDARPDVSAVPARFRTERFWGTRVLSLVIIVNEHAPPVDDYGDLIEVAAGGGVAIPDPTFSGSAFAALAFFTLSEGYGPEWLASLRAAGTTVVRAPGDVVTGVAEGRFAAGITLDFSARAAVGKGSPIEIVWPTGGAISFYSPIAVTGSDARSEGFVTYVLGREAQDLIADTGWQPVRPDVGWHLRGPQVSVPWDRVFDRQGELFDGYRAVFGG